ncbi:hypothetical protein KC19_6G140100 [Ceratodon purpureus]|uniref:Uncharacterized protein n=1 Tax=Ceratodon purpureus TaxID=3225 RepID=A0A8T0HFP4_CERPU|nr:hypothetical protein KC19_6G140100 [Ceratodon purpureus]
MATSLTVSSKFTITSYRSEVFGDCGNVDQGRSAKRNVSLSNSLLGPGRWFRHRHVRNWQDQEGKKGPSPCQALFGRKAPDDKNDEGEDSSNSDSNNASNNLSSEAFRQQMERMVNSDNKDVSFRGIDLATLIRKKYGRSYDVQFIKKEFMGRQLLAMNVMWKYREQRSFPLTEEEYLLHLDDIANNLRCWGAVGLVRNGLEKTKERPRIGKAVSIFIDLDESGGRAREWINRLETTLELEPYVFAGESPS